MVGIALDAGVNFFNTAEGYSQGLAEQILGKALGSRRKDVIVTTKAAYHGVVPTTGLNNAGLSRKHIIEACEASLKRLGTDYVDVYEAHGLDPKTSHEITIRALDDLVHQGKARDIGCSNYAAWNLMKGLAISEKYGLEKFSTLESMYSLLARWMELEVIPACIDQEVAVLAYSPLHAGLLAGKYRRDLAWPQNTRIATDDSAAVRWPFEKEKLFGLVDELTKMAHDHQASVPQAALNWVLQKPGICSAIVGFRTSAQLEDSLGAVKWRLTDDEMARLDKLTAPERQHPYDARLRQASDAIYQEEASAAHG